MKYYAERDIMTLDELGNHYGNHVQAVTAEGLHSKSDIAAELAWRDAENPRSHAGGNARGYAGGMGRRQ